MVQNGQKLKLGRRGRDARAKSSLGQLNNFMKNGTGSEKPSSEKFVRFDLI